MTTGSLIIRLQDAIDSLSFLSEEEREEFLGQVGANLKENLRQNLLTWRTNRSTPADVRNAEALDKARRSGV